jgi:uncharacterized FlaG/YvyC family protein
MMIKLSQQDDYDPKEYNKVFSAMCIIAAINLGALVSKLKTHGNDTDTIMRVIQTIIDDTNSVLAKGKAKSGSTQQSIDGLQSFIAAKGLEKYDFGEVLENLVDELEYDVNYFRNGEHQENLLKNLDNLSDTVVKNIQEKSGVDLSHVLNSGKVLSGVTESGTNIPINKEKDTAEIPSRISPKIKKDISDVSDPRDSLQSTLEYSPNNPIDAEKPDVIKNYEREIEGLPEPEGQKRLDRFKFAYLMKCAWLVCDMIKNGKIK